MVTGDIGPQYMPDIISLLRKEREQKREKQLKENRNFLDDGVGGALYAEHPGIIAGAALERLAQERGISQPEALLEITGEGGKALLEITKEGGQAAIDAVKKITEIVQKELRERRLRHLTEIFDGPDFIGDNETPYYISFFMSDPSCLDHTTPLEKAIKEVRQADVVSEDDAIQFLRLYSRIKRIYGGSEPMSNGFLSS